MGDKRKAGQVTVWEQEIGKLEGKKSYKLSGMMICSFGYGNDEVAYSTTGIQGSKRGS